MKKYILTEQVVEKKLRRLAYEILENNADEASLILAGVLDNGYIIASCIRRLLDEIGHMPTEMISISLDKKNPEKVELSRELSFENKVIIVIDDVASTGKTLMYCLQPFLTFHPRKIQALVLVERTHKTFPVKPDYTGLSIATTLQEHIYVEVEGEKVKGAWLE